jgi:hypothetical protein
LIHQKTCVISEKNITGPQKHNIHLIAKLIQDNRTHSRGIPAENTEEELLDRALLDAETEMPSFYVLQLFLLAK